jgi:hypothetical protein
MLFHKKKKIYKLLDRNTLIIPTMIKSFFFKKNIILFKKYIFNINIVFFDILMLKIYFKK